MPNIENNQVKHLIMVGVDTSGHGIAKGKRLNSSITVNIYWFFEEEGNGPLKSEFILSHGCIALIKCAADGL